MNPQTENVVTLDVSSSGQMFAKSQITDYQCRGTELQEYNLVDFFTDTYEVEITRADRAAELVSEDIHRGPGRPRNTRVRYLTTHPKSATVHRIIRSAGHRNLPNFLGRWFPRSDDTEIYDFYCACMLLLLKPWRDITTDLKTTTETWASAFEEFCVSASKKEHRIMSGIQYFHECESAAHAEDVQPYPHTTPADQNSDDELGVDHIPITQGLSEEGLALLKTEAISLREEQHGRMAIEIAKHLGIFRNDQSAWLIGESTPANATEDALSRISMWSGLLLASTNGNHNARGSNLPPTTPTTASIEQSHLIDGSPGSSLPTVVLQLAGSEQALPAVDLGSLKRDQLRAYQIVDWHLGETLRGTSPPPLRMILYGEGGTGKSRVIQTITESFAVRRASHMLVKAAYTGVAASLVNGKTTHVIAGISLGTKRGSVTDASKKKLQDFWREVQYLIVDEYSMLSKTFLATLSRNISIGMEGTEGFQAGRSFGGLNVILCGDLHQFPPVACSKREALYHPLDTRDSLDAQIGRQTYEEFSTVVILKEQMRVSDPTWRDFLEHLRYGKVEPRHLKMLRTLILRRTTPSSDPPLSPADSHSLPAIDFVTQPWVDAALITPRHAVRTQWNEATSQKRCSETGRHLFICPALDTIKGSLLTLEERYALASRHKNTKRRRNKDLPESILLAIGMKVMVTNNLQTDLDITNGARGVITDIILNQNEPPLEDGSTVRLKLLPECVLVKLSRTRAAALPHLEEGVIPIQRITCHMQIKVNGKSRTVARTQFPITGADSFTDYRAQGQTIPYVIIDIAPPPTSGLSLFNLYVSLSRSSGRETIRLLRDFEDEMFLQAHEPELIDEDERLERMNLATKEWWDKLQVE